MFLIILSIVSLIRALLIIAIIFLIIRWFSKLFLPGYSDNHQGTYSSKHQTEGETTIQTKHQEKKNSTREKGEYVDFEEIE